MKKLRNILLNIIFIILFFGLASSGYIGVVVILFIITVFGIVTLPILKRSLTEYRLKTKPIFHTEPNHLVEVQGEISADELILNALDQEPAVYNYYAEQEVTVSNNKNREKRIRTIYSETQFAKGIYIKDQTGKIYLDENELFVDESGITLDRYDFEESTTDFVFKSGTPDKVDQIHNMVMLDKTDVLAIGYVKIINGKKTLTKEKRHPYFVTPTQKLRTFRQILPILLTMWCAFIFMFIVDGLFLVAPVFTQLINDGMVLVIPDFWSYFLSKLYIDPIVVCAIACGVCIGLGIIAGIAGIIPFIGRLLKYILVVALAMIPILIIQTIFLFSFSLHPQLIWSANIVIYLLLIIVAIYLCFISHPNNKRDTIDYQSPLIR